MKSFFRFLGKNKIYAAINIFGLAISLMFVILIADFSVTQLDVDRFHANKDRIYLMGSEKDYCSNYYVANKLFEKFPEIEKGCCTFNMTVDAFISEDHTLPTETIFADSTFFSIFDFPFVEGDRNTALDSKDKAVITESYAIKMFGSKDAMGKTIKLSANGKEPFEVIVSAIIKDFHKTVIKNDAEMVLLAINSDRLAPYDLLSKNIMVSGGPTCTKSFLMTYPDADMDAKNPEILSFLKEISNDYQISAKKQVVFTPLTKVKLDPKNSYIWLESGSKETLFILLAAGIAILIFAITNYINLTVAQTGFRAKEMASRKLLGSSGAHVTLRMICESTLMTAASFVIGFLLAYFFQGYASKICGAPIDLIKSASAGIIVIYILSILFLGFISGIIPAYAISRFNPIDIVKGSLRYRSKMVFSKIFICFQNTITIVLLVSAMTIYFQIRHLVTAPLGHNVDGILELIDFQMTAEEERAFKNEASQLACVEEIGMGKNSSIISSMYSIQSFTDKNGEKQWMTMMKMDSSAIHVMGLELVSPKHMASDPVYINERAAAALGIDINDSEFAIDFGGGSQNKNLGGIFKDFRSGTVLEDIKPIVIAPLEEDLASDNYMAGSIFYIKVRGDVHESYQTIQDLYTKIVKNGDHSGLNIAQDVIDENFSKEQNTAKLVLFFAIIAIIISALGLFAMSTYFTRQRIKDIGVRKIFGGTRKEILTKQLWQFIRPLIVSFIIAIPVAYYIMDQWIQNYSYRIPLYPWIFIAAGAFVIIIGIATVLGESLKAVNENPIKAIRTE